MRLAELTAYLDDYLAIRDVPDYKDAFNGLQVEGPEDVNRIAIAVDACQATIRAASEKSADMLLVHHGLFWGAKAPITGGYFKRIYHLITNSLALYSCHLPLDAHPEVGNNHVLCRLLGLKPAGMYGDFDGVPIGVWAESSHQLDALAEQIGHVLGVTPHIIRTGPAYVRKVGIVTGGGGSWIDRTANSGCDTLITGEGAHHTYFDAEERGINVIYAGHYATETVGVKALGDHLTQRFGLETFFIDHPTGL